MYEFLNYFFFVFHTALTLFNMFGWVHRRIRKIHLISLLLTAFSWFVLGIWYGWGYCLFTDWHWEIREELGYNDQSRSYIHFKILKLTGLNLNVNTVEMMTALGFFISLGLSIYLNIRDRKRKGYS